MGTPIVYPASLPMPQAAPIQSDERRVLAPSGGPYDVRALQRDRLSVQRVTFPPMNKEDSEEFQRWWRDDLQRGGAKFAATWPLPQGLIPAVRRFIGAPQWEFLPTPQGNYWRIKADVEVFGRGELPEDGFDCFTESFIDGIDSFATTHGVRTPFHSVAGTSHGNAFSGGQPETSVILDAYDEISKSIASRRVSRWSFYALVSGETGQDTPSIILKTGAAQTIFFISRRQFVSDALQRAVLVVDGDQYIVSGAALEVNRWYLCRLSLSGGSSLFQLVHENGTTETTSLAGYGALFVDALAFTVDYDGLGSSGMYADVDICTATT